MPLKKIFDIVDQSLLCVAVCALSFFPARAMITSWETHPFQMLGTNNDVSPFSPHKEHKRTLFSSIMISCGKIQEDCHKYSYVCHMWSHPFISGPTSSSSNEASMVKTFWAL